MIFIVSVRLFRLYPVDPGVSGSEIHVNVEHAFRGRYILGLEVMSGKRVESCHLQSSYEVPVIHHDAYVVRDIQIDIRCSPLYLYPVPGKHVSDPYRDIIYPCVEFEHLP